MVRSFGWTKPPPSAQINFGHPLARKLVLAYPLNEGAGNYCFNAADQQCNPPGPDREPSGAVSKNSTLQIANGPSWSPGLLGGVGLKYLNISAISSLYSVGTNTTTGFDTTSNPFSLSVWIQYFGFFSDFGTSGGPTVFARQTSNADSHWNISAKLSTNHLQRYSGFDTGFVLATNTTYHIVYTFDAATSDTSGTEKFYVNGQLIASQTGTVPASVTGASAPVFVGTSSSGFFPWNGLIDWPMMWNGRVLSNSDVEWLYSEPWAIFPEPVRKQAYFFVPSVPKPVTITDNLGLSDSIKGPSTSRNRSLSDNLGVNDSPQIITRTQRNATDNIGVSDSVIRGLMAWLRLAQDNLGVAEQHTRLTATFRNIQETSLALTDTFKRLVPIARRVWSDNLGVHDAIGSGRLWFPNPQDNLGVSDSFARKAPALRALSDNLGLSDQVSRLQSALRALSDNLGVSDSPISGGGRPIRLTDNLALSDSINTAPHYWIRLWSDFLALTDTQNIPSLVTWPINVSDFLALSDQPGFANILLRLVTDYLALTDVYGPGNMPWTRQIIDYLALSDSPQFINQYLRLLVDYLALADQVLPLGFIWLRQITDYLALTDVIAPLRQPPSPPQPMLTLRWAIPQPAVGQHAWLVRGADHVYLFVPDQGPTNIANWSLRWDLSTVEGEAITGIEQLEKNTAGSGLAITDPINGLIQLQLSAADTRRLAVQGTVWFWELRRYDAGADTTLARGTFTIQKEWFAG